MMGKTDGGHGGHDSGATYGSIKEKDMALRIDKHFTEAMLSSGISMERTRSADVYVNLGNRNTGKRDFFVSHHINSVDNSTVNGLEVLYNNNHPKSKELAQYVLDELWNTGLYSKNRGLKHRDNLAVLRNKNAPSILVEYGFIKNDKERNMMLKNEKELANAVKRGVLKFLGKEDNSMNKKDIEKMIDEVVKPSKTKGGSPNAHWAYKNYEKANKTIDGLMTERRFDDMITRGEVITLLERVIDHFEK